jgi:hypothetical protein
MPFIHGRNAAVLHGAYNLSSFLNDGSVATDSETAETTAFGNSAKTYISGLKDGTVSASGMFDGSASAIDEVLQASLGSDTLSPVLFAMAGLTAGNRCRLLQAKTTSYEVSSPVGDVVSVSYDAQSDGGIDAGVILANGAQTTSTNSASIDNAASSTNGGLAQLHVTANSMNNNTVLKVQHSADNSTWVDLVTFTTVATTVTTSERSVVSSATTVNRYLRATSTMSGTGSITFTVAFARR